MSPFGSEMLPGRGGFLSSDFADATKEPHSYIVVNAHQPVPEELRVIGNLFDAKHAVAHTQD